MPGLVKNEPGFFIPSSAFLPIYKDDLVLVAITAAKATTRYQSLKQ